MLKLKPATLLPPLGLDKLVLLAGKLKMLVGITGGAALVDLVTDDQLYLSIGRMANLEPAMTTLSFKNSPGNVALPAVVKPEVLKEPVRVISTWLPTCFNVKTKPAKALPVVSKVSSIAAAINFFIALSSKM